MKRAGFTMIELIFVIVILGILAAVAIPKLAATRDDAKASTLLTSLGTCINDAGGAYMMEGVFAGPPLPVDGGLNSDACTDVDVLTCYTIVVGGTPNQLDVAQTGNAALMCTQAYSGTPALDAKLVGTHSF